MRNCLRNPYFWIKFVILLSSILYFLSISLSIFLKTNEIDIGDENFNEISKCPLCYGKRLCNQIKNYKILKLETNVLGDDTYLFNRIVNIKNVYYAKLKYSQKVVIKKLAHRAELEQFDTEEKKCDSLNCISKIIHSKYKFLTPNTFSPQVLDIEFGTCFSDRLIDMILKNYKEYDQTNDR